MTEQLSRFKARRKFLTHDVPVLLAALALAACTPNGSAPADAPTAENNGGALGATNVPPRTEVEIPRLDLHNHEGTIGLSEGQKTELRHRITTDPEAMQVYTDTIKTEADRILSQNLQPKPVEQILVTSDRPATEIAAGKEALKDMEYAYKLAFAATVEPESTHYADKVKQYVLAWARTNQSTGNPINETNFDRMWIAYDLVKEAFNSAEQEEVARWIDSVAQKQVQTGYTIGNTGINNWRNHKDKIVLMAGVVTGKQELVDHALADYQDQMADFYHADGTTYDFEERDALAYQTYGLLPSAEMARVYALNGGGDLYHLRNTKGGSIADSVHFLLPFVNKEQAHTEFVNTTVPSDRKRSDANQPWRPNNAITVLESASYFEPILIPYLYNAVDDKDKKPPVISHKYPTFNSLVYSVQHATA